MKLLIAALVLLLALAAPVSAAPPVSSISVNETDLHYLSHATWTIQTNAQQYTVYVECSANETTVLNGNVQSPMWAAYDNYNTGFPIGASLNPYWVGGGANCVALLQKYTWNQNTGFRFTTLASTSFVVAPD